MKQDKIEEIDVTTKEDKEFQQLLKVLEKLKVEMSIKTMLAQLGPNWVTILVCLFLSFICLSLLL